MLLQLREKLIDERSGRQLRPIAARLLQHDAEILAHPIDREAEIKLTLQHGGGAIVHLPRLRRAAAYHLQDFWHVEPRALAKIKRFGKSLNDPRATNLIDHLSELTRARGT